MKRNCELNVNILVYILVILYGIGSWIETNGLWVELPILVHEAPEGWSLPSYIAVIAQIGNLGPLFFILTNKWTKKRFNEKHGTYIIVVLGIAGCIVLIIFWKKTAFVMGAERSVGLLASVLLLVFTDCTSSVVFLPYMSMFKPEYVSALFIGEGLSGMLPALVALVQNVGENVCLNVTVNSTTNETRLLPQYIQPKFPVEHFFVFLFLMLCVCGTAFALLNHLPYCRREYVQQAASKTKLSLLHLSSADDSLLDKSESRQSTLYSPVASGDVEDSERKSQKHIPLSRMQYVFLLFLTGLINVLSNGIILSVCSYSTLPYGDSVYHLSTTLMSIINPCACVAAFFLSVKSVQIITSVTVLGAALSSYILFIAAYSPMPPLAGQDIGGILIVSKI